MVVVVDIVSDYTSAIDRKVICSVRRERKRNKRIYYLLERQIFYH